MPSKNSTKIYIENGYYHVYNRGADKRPIFEDEEDYRVFLSLLKTYLSPKGTVSKHPLVETSVAPTRLRPLPCFEGKIQLLTYCLMPNHFHLLVKQTDKNDMSNFMRSLCTTYSMYFNKKYKRTGTLYQGKYKAVNVENDAYLLHLTRYIHLNPSGLTGSDPVSKYPYSSYQYYLGGRNAVWVKPEPILAYFKTAQRTSLRDCLSYQSFIEDYKEDSAEILGSLTIEEG